MKKQNLKLECELENILKYAREQRHHAATGVHTTTSNIAQLAYKRMHGKKKKHKGLQAQQVVQEVYSKVEDLDERTNTKRKNRTVGPGSYEEEQFQDNNTKKGKSKGIQELPNRQAKILKVAEVCGVELPNAHQGMNYTSATFGS